MLEDKTRGFIGTAIIVVVIVIIAGIILYLKLFPKGSVYNTVSTGTTTQIAKSLPLSECMPAGIKLTDEVSLVVTTSTSTGPAYIVSTQHITLQQKLNESRMSCTSDRTLVDASGKQVKIFPNTACWRGPAPSNYRDLIAKQSAELSLLKQKYEVIEIPCYGFIPEPP